jgi:glycoside/pentoside/hexuronide:cation symporter, GPH family
VQPTQQLGGKTDSGTGGEPSLWRLVIYSLPALPLALLTLPFYVLVPSYYASVGLPLALIGQVLLAVRIFDAFSDPIAGFLSDRTKLAFGRRKTWLAAGAPLTALGAYMVFAPPAEVTLSHLLVWSFILTIGWTIAVVPYSAWGAEISQSYDGRTRVTSIREGLAFIGTLAALVLQFVVGDLERTLDIFAAIIAIGLPLAAFLTLWLVPEPANQTRSTVGFRDSYAFLRNNLPFRRLILAYLVNGLANGLPATLFLMFVSDRLGLADKAGLFLIIYFVSGVVGMPLWLRLARSVSKHRSWCHAMILACLAFAFAPWLPQGSVIGFTVVCVITGLAVGADLALPASLQADVIDIDTAASGEQRSGLYLALWGLATKLALALAVGIAFPVLAAAGYDPGVGQKSDLGLNLLAFFYAGLPVLLKLAAVAMMWNFPLDRARQEELRTAILRRRTELGQTS